MYVYWKRRYYSEGRWGDGGRSNGLCALGWNERVKVKLNICSFHQQINTASLNRQCILSPMPDTKDVLVETGVVLHLPMAYSLVGKLNK